MIANKFEKCTSQIEGGHTVLHRFAECLSFLVDNHQRAGEALTNNYKFYFIFIILVILVLETALHRIEFLFLKYLRRLLAEHGRLASTLILKLD